jgi:hypothetical protein
VPSACDFATRIEDPVEFTVDRYLAEGVEVIEIERGLTSSQR